MDSRGVTPYLKALVSLFYREIADLGTFERVDPAEMPPVYCALLDHQNHMTVTVEKHHGCPVEVRVLETKISGNQYARKILLARKSDGRVVQYGIVQLNFDCVSDEVRREIESQKTPLGRVLIEHNVLREIHLFKLWKVVPGAELQKLFGLSTAETTYGRTAAIHFDGEPAVELLEIVAPEPRSNKPV